MTSKSARGYVGWGIADATREHLLGRFPPHYRDVIAHHITLQHGVREDEAVLPTATRARVIASVDDGLRVQALIVEIDGTHVRPDGSTYHITWSIDRLLGAKPVMSHAVAKNCPWTATTPLEIEIVPMFFAS